MGAGGVGGFFGARLALAGADVTLIARGAHLAALRGEGLRVEGELLTAGPLAVAATDDPGAVGPAGLVLMTAKAYDLEQAARAIAPMVGPETAVLPLLNGVDITGRIGAQAGPAHVLGGVAYVFSHIAEPGRIRHVGIGRVIAGEPDGGLSPRVQRIVAVLGGAGIEIEATDDVQRAIWAKFAGLLPTAGLAALTRATVGRVREDPDTRALFVACEREVIAVARARGVALDDDLTGRHLALIDGLPAESRPSLALDLARGRRLEADSLHGTLCRLGREAGVPTPVNDAIYAALKFHAAGADAA